MEEGNQKMLLVQGVFFFFHINKMTEEKKDEENNVPRVSSPFLKVEGRGRRRLKRRRDLHRGVPTMKKF